MRLHACIKLSWSYIVTAPTNWKKGKLLGSGAFGQVSLYSKKRCSLA